MEILVQCRSTAQLASEAQLQAATHLQNAAKLRAAAEWGVTAKTFVLSELDKTPVCGSRVAYYRVASLPGAASFER